MSEKLHREAADELLKEAYAMFERHKQLAENAEPPEDMGEFERTVQKLCQQVNRLPKDESKHFYKAFDELSEGLKTLAGRLEKQKLDVQERITNSSYNTKAQVAYRTSAHLAPKDNKGDSE